MTLPLPIHFAETNLDTIDKFAGKLAILVPEGSEIVSGQAGRKLNRLTRGAILRAITSEAFSAVKPGEALELAFPAGLQAQSLMIVKIGSGASVEVARKAGATIGKSVGEAGALVLAMGLRRAAELAFGLAMRAYDFNAHKTAPVKLRGGVTVMVNAPEQMAVESARLAALAEGVFFTRDLVNEPANVLTTTEFANRLVAMQNIGLEVEVLEEAQMAELGMGALLGVGLGSETPSKLVIMRWNGGGDEAPFALVGKGVVFDTGGISIKPAGGMEDMTMDMGGAGVVAGVMRTLALRKAKANVVGLVGLVENMPDGKAQRPGDVVKSMKGDTIEVINTDAEGRLVLADVLWYAQERFKPTGMINLATLTGAIIVALGHENTGVFSNSDDLCNAFLKAAKAEGEGAWRMPMGDAYDAKLKSRIADMMNVGGRDGGSITAAQFLKRFVKPDMPWCHLDIAGTALLKADSTLAPKGATGWGVMALDRLIRDKYEV
jgi:leucyl aminopeptidase